MTLLDEDTSVVDGLGKAELEDQGLQAALQEVLRRQGQHVIQLVLSLLQKSVLVHSPQEGLTLKQPHGVLVVPRQQCSCCLPDPADAPNTMSGPSPNTMCFVLLSFGSHIARCTIFACLRPPAFQLQAFNVICLPNLPLEQLPNTAWKCLGPDAGQPLACCNILHRVHANESFRWAEPIALSADVSGPTCGMAFQKAQPLRPGSRHSYCRNMPRFVTNYFTLSTHVSFTDAGPSKMQDRPSCWDAQEANSVPC